VLIFCIAGLLFIVLRARRTLGAYRIPRRPAFSFHLVSGYRKCGVESWYDRYVRIANKAQLVRMRGGELLRLSSALFQYWQLRKSD
jgi:hypothetical protein